MACFADQASSVVTEIIENVPIARDTMRLRLHLPEMASMVVPGQFFMLRNPAGNDPLIGRAFALYDLDVDQGWIDIVYLVKGKLTTSLASLVRGAPVAVWGPLGNGFESSQINHAIMVAGGIGQTPFLTLAKEMLGQQSFGVPGRLTGRADRATLCYGVRTRECLAGVEQFREAGVDVRIATEDGSIGPPRRVTELLAEVLAEVGGENSQARVLCCGPEPMMAAVAQLTLDKRVECFVSLETPMACGIGICFTCVAKVGTPGDWDYKRTCVEGPVFNARDIVWS